MNLRRKRISFEQPKGDENDWGFTNNLARVALLREYRAAMIADGWVCRPTYDHESVDSASKLEREGFVCSILTRMEPADKPSKWKGCASISMWGPDGMALQPPDRYSWEVVRSRVRHCNLCDADDVETVRYSFAGRCCKKCASLPGHNEKYHYPGWTN